VQLGQDQDGGQRINAAEAPEPLYPLAIRRGLGHVGQPRIECAQPGLEVVKRMIAGEAVEQGDSGLAPREWRELMATLGRENAD